MVPAELSWLKQISWLFTVVMVNKWLVNGIVLLNGWLLLSEYGSSTVYNEEWLINGPCHPITAMVELQGRCGMVPCQTSGRYHARSTGLLFVLPPVVVGNRNIQPLFLLKGLWFQPLLLYQPLYLLDNIQYQHYSLLKVVGYFHA